MVPIDIVPDRIPEQHTASRMQLLYLDNSHTIEIAVKDITVRISNDALERAGGELLPLPMTPGQLFLDFVEHFVATDSLNPL